MLVLRCVQPPKHLSFQSSGWVAAITVGRSKVTTAEEESAPPQFHNPSSGHLRIHCHNSATLIRVAAPLPPDLSGHLLYKRRQVVESRPAAALVLSKAFQLDHLKWVPLDSRAISVKGKNRSDSDFFEEWFNANPLPDVSLQEVKQRGNGGLALAAHNEAYDNYGTEKFRITDGKASVEESGEFHMLPDTNRMADREQELSAIKNLDPTFDKMKGFLNGPEKVSGLRLGELGLQHLREFSWEETGDVLYECLCKCEDLAWDCEQKRFLEVNPSRGGWRIAFIPPLIQLPLSSCCTPREYLQSLHQRRDRQGNKQLLVLLSSNAAALAIFNDGKLLLHKVITAYTVRAKQGKSQLKYLRQGGPGRMTVGVAIRAREADRFFTRICEKLDEWGNEIQDCEVLFFSGTTRIWNEVYAADNPKVLVPRNDRRWCKIPFSVHEPRLREVKRVFYSLSHGAVGFSFHREQRPV